MDANARRPAQSSNEHPDDGAGCPPGPDLATTGRVSSQEWAMDAPSWRLRAAPRSISSSHRRLFFMNQRFMNQRWNRRAVLALVLVAIMVAPFGQLGRGAGAQEATPAGIQSATPVPGAQTWHVLVNNVSPEG